MNQNIKALTYGAMSVALMALLYLLNVLTGGYSEIFTLFIAPIPLMIYTIQYGLKNGVIVLVSTIIVGFILAGLTTMFMLSAAFLSGLLMGYLMARPYSKVVRCGSCIIVLLVANILSMVIFASLFGYDLIEESRIVAQTVLDMVPVSGLTMDDLMAMMPMVMLFSILLESICSGFVSYYLGVIILKRLKLYIEPSRSTMKWDGPISGYILMGIYILYLLQDHFELSPSLFALVALSGSIVQLILAIYGINRIGRYGRIHNKAWLPLVLIVVLMVLPSIALFLLTCIGFLCMTTNLLKG